MKGDIEIRKWRFETRRNGALGTAHMAHFKFHIPHFTFAIEEGEKDLKRHDCQIHNDK
jgi:hypothetical protein